MQLCRTWPGIDVALAKLTLLELDRIFRERLQRASSRGEKAALVEQWATYSRRELHGIDTTEARLLRTVYRAIARAA